MENGGTLLAIGSAVETARDLLDLPIERALPQAPPRFGPRGGRAPQTPPEDATALLTDTFSSPSRLKQTLRDRVSYPPALTETTPLAPDRPAQRRGGAERRSGASGWNPSN